MIKVFNSLNSLPDFNNAVATLGTFDGVHYGHKKIMERMDYHKENTGGESVLLTFWPHPRMVLQPDDNSLRLLNTIDEKIKLLSMTKLDNLIVIPFTKEFSRLSSIDFIREILVGKLNVKTLIVGHDHHFGRNREGTFEELAECAPVYRYELEKVDAFYMDDITISSTRIRNLLLNDNLLQANKYLGYTYHITGTVEHGDHRGTAIGFPTANILVPEKYKLLPRDGVYAVTINLNGTLLKGMMNIGHRPTFGGLDRKLEVHIFNFNEDIYGSILSINFLDKIRSEVTFAAVDDLIAQLQRDKTKAEEILNHL